MAAPEPADSFPKVSETGNSQAAKFGQKSWVKAVQQKHVLVNHEVNVEEVEGKQLVEIPDDLLVNSVPLWDDFLEGRFLDPAPHVSRIHIIVNKIWPLGNKTIKIDVFSVNERTVKFRIFDQQTRLRILKRGVWNIAGIPMVLSKWAPLAEKEDTTEVKTVPMWVILKNVPHSMFSWEGLGFIASAVGKPVRLHPETELCTNFEEAKVFVNANMTKPLPTTHRFCSKSGINADIEYSYPWIPTKCSTCQAWGHNGKECPKFNLRAPVANLQKELRSEDNGMADGSSFSKQKDSEVEVIVTKEGNGKMGSTDVTMMTKSVVQSEISISLEEKVQGETEKLETVVEGSHKEAREESETQKTEDDSWMNVSPGKVGRSAESKTCVETVISPSRFQLLAEDEEVQVSSLNKDMDSDTLKDLNHFTPELEEGEISETEVGVFKSDDPRSTAPTAKLAQSARKASKAMKFAMATKVAKPNGTSKKRTSKKN